jgi:hypothetical protein
MSMIMRMIRKPWKKPEHYDMKGPNL